MYFIMCKLPGKQAVRLRELTQILADKKVAYVKALLLGELLISSGQESQQGHVTAKLSKEVKTKCGENNHVYFQYRPSA